MRIIAALICLTVATGNFCAGQSTQPDPVSSDDPKSIVQSLAVAVSTGDAAAMRDLLYAKSDTDQKLVAAISDTAVAVADLRRAMVSKFGVAKANTVMPDPAGVVKSASENMKTAVEKIDGDTATVSTGHPPRVNMMTMKKIDGKWKVDVAAYVKAGSPAQVETMLANINRGVAVFKDLVDDVNSGKLDSPEAVKSEMTQRMKSKSH